MRKHYLNELIFSLLAFVTSVAGAKTVPVDEARQLAVEFFQATSLDRPTSEDELELAFTSLSGDRPLYYVFNVGQGDGYIIMSAEDCAAPILGYSQEGKYDAASLPPAMKWMLKGLENEIKAVPGLQQSQSRENRSRMVRRAAAGEQRILLQTPEWSQEAPFNNMIPGNPLAGCVGTAMATIMRYHSFPERGTGSYNGVNFDVAYDWSNMRMDNYRSGYTQAEADAVATLIYHAGVSIGTQFGYSGSSAYEVKVPAALVNYFNYDPGVSYKKRSEVKTQADFDRIVENEIRASRPVLYCGQDVTSGHAFVVDGYDPMSGMLHINWGWGGATGNNNGGWYVSTALNPTVSQSHSFNNLTTIIYNIKPGNGDNAAWSPLHITADGRQCGMSSDLEGNLTAGNSFTVRVGNIKNVSYSNFGGKIAVALFGADGTFKTTLCTPVGFHLNAMTIFGSAYADFQCTLPEGATVEDGDVIRMTTLADGADTWLPVPGELPTTNEIPAKGATPGYFTVGHTTPLADATFTGEDRVIRGWNYRFRVVPANPDREVVTVRNNGCVLTRETDDYYTVRNVLEDQQIEIYVQNAADVIEKRSVWVGTPGTLSETISAADAGTIKELTVFGTIDANDFTFIRTAMKLTRLDLSGARIAANGNNQANAVPREAFRNLWSLQEVILPSSVNRLNNGAFRLCGIKSIVIPAAVTTIEYNVFNGSSGLKDIWVLNPNPVFVNWCVFSGCPKDRTVHCPDESSATRYKNDKYWNQPDVDTGVNFVAGKYEAPSDVAFAVMENSDVRYISDTEPGRYEKGRKIVFTAEHIADNDNRMDVYANNTLLKPDTEGKYSVTLTANTILHFDLVKPVAPAAYDSHWILTDTDGTVGLLTDAVNVIPGVPFAVRINSFDATGNAFWAMVLTTSDGAIKEFISPVSNWSNGPASNQRMTVNCCVKDATVREGNLIRLATSYNNKTWALVKGSNENVIDGLPALNNQTPVYNFTFPEDLSEKANLSGIVTSAVRGRDLTFRITPKSASHTLDVSINGENVLEGGKTFTHSFIAKENLDFDVKVIPPVSYTEATIVLEEGQHLYLYYAWNDPNAPAGWSQKNKEFAQKYSNIKKLKIVGKLDYYDFNFFRDNADIASNIRTLDLSEATFVYNRDKTASTGLDNVFPGKAFYNSSTKRGCNIEEIILPESLTQFEDDSFMGCGNIKELRLPAGLRTWSLGKTPNNAGGFTNKTRGGLNDNVFAGCNSLETLYVPCVPKSGNNVGHWYYFDGHPVQSGLPDNKKVTVVVNPDYLQAYTTPKTASSYDAQVSAEWSNGWVGGGFNIVGQYPVYSLEYDASRCFPADKDLDITKAASFLKDNIGLETIERKLYIARKSEVTDNRPEGIDAFAAGAKVKVYDNGVLLADDAIAADGSITLTYHNPNKHLDKSGSHEVEVVYLYDINFNCASDNLKVLDEDGSHLTSVEVSEGMPIKFRIEMADTQSTELTSVVKINDIVLPSGDDGYYTIDAADSDLDINVYTVPRNGATLSPDNIAMINAAEASGVINISFAGEIDDKTLVNVISQLPEIEEINFSGLTSPLPANAVAGKETVKTVVLPQADAIEDGTFSGCSALESVAVPATVNFIGSRAFEGCASLTSLSFTGISGVGAHAFADCDNLTSIIFNTNHAGSAPAARVKSTATRSTGYSPDAFAGLNPNCIIYLDENETIATGTAANFVKVKTVEDGVNKYRVYESLGDISIDPAYSFSALNPITLPEGREVNLELELCKTNGLSAWSPIVLPFAPTAVSDAEGNPMTLHSGKETAFTGKDYAVATLAEGASDLTLASAIEANRPYLVGTCGNTEGGKVKFSAQNGTVAQTPDEIVSNGSDYTLHATYESRSLDAATTYMLDAEGSSFAAIGAAPLEATDADNDARANISPFSVYAEAPADHGTININIPINDYVTGVDHVGDDRTGLRIERRGDTLVIYSDKACEIKVFGIDGILVKVLHLSAGANTVAGLRPGNYIMNGVKTAF